MNTLADGITLYHPTTWADVAFAAVIGAAIVGFAWAKNRRKP